MFSETIISRMESCGVVAGFSVNAPEEGVEIARALLAGGIDVIELTLRTDGALAGLRMIREEVPEIVAGVGTILTLEQAREVKELGAAYGVSPGLNRDVVAECGRIGLDFAPGIATPSELETAISMGCRLVKFFPSEPLGGLRYLKSMATPYRHLGVQYFPLGGINTDNLVSYLQEDDIPAVGGSWIVNKQDVQQQDWAAITRRARLARTAIDDARKKGRP